MAKLYERTARANLALIEKRRHATETPWQMFFPGLETFMRAMPNQIARSSLFAPIAKGHRKMHNATVLVSRKDGVLEYSGEQLDEADADIVLQLMYEALQSIPGQPVTINRAAFLRAIGRNTGKSDYTWLHRRIKALTAATLFIEARRSDGSAKYRVGDTKAFHILSDFEYNEGAETYTYTLDQRWKVLFGNREFALIDWEKRLNIGRGQDMAKALQLLVATSADPVQRYALDWLKAKMQYGSPLRKFKVAIKAATDELERLQIIAGARFALNTRGKEQMVWTKL
ncbi:TrfA protein [Collimonas sp. PA-H2]|nr:TrfA protein [Collimonas sp. PA-H2]